MSFFFHTVACLLALFVASCSADCQCESTPTVESSYREAQVALLVRVRDQVLSKEPFTNVYEGRVKMPFKDDSCEDISSLRGSNIQIHTSIFGTSCGVGVLENEKYLFFGDLDRTAKPVPVLRIHSCQYQRVWTDVPQSERDFVRNERKSMCRCQEEANACGDKPPIARARAVVCPDGPIAESDLWACRFNAESETCEWGILPCPPKNEESLDLFEDPYNTVTRCNSDDQCDVGTFCGNSGICRGHGTCGDEDDCSNPSNKFPEPQYFCDPPSVRSYTCSNQGQCSSGCETPCGSNSDCLNGHYCSLNGICREIGACAADGDCTLPSHKYPVEARGCVPPSFRAYYCTDEGGCSFSCEAPVCTSDAGCWGRSYCSSSGICRQNGTCAEDGDCRKPSNHYSVAQFDCAPSAVVGHSCTRGYCSADCTGPDTTPACNSDDDCSVDSYCADGICRENGTCGNVQDCTNLSNRYAVKQCAPSVIICNNEGQCTNSCGGRTLLRGSRHLRRLD